jgi:outer membrane protein OmpA-like peptidoglycan-associated protein
LITNFDNMRILTTIAALSMIFDTFLAQQQYTGYVTDNFNCYTGSYSQPASIVNSQQKISIVGSFMSLNTSNAIGRNGSNVSALFGNQLTKYREHRSGGYFMKNLSLDLFAFSYELNHKQALGYSFRIRQFGNINGLDKIWTKAIHSKYDLETPLNTPIGMKNFEFQQFIFNEHRFNYAHVLKDDGENFFKAGIALKLVNGIDAVYLHANSGTMQFTDPQSSNAQFTNTEFQYGRAEKKNAFTSRKLGIGTDIGFVYEFRPDHKTYRYDMDGEKNIERYDKVKYKYKIGASITDIGRVKFTKDTNSYDFTAGNIKENATYISTLGINTNINNSFSLFKNFDSIAKHGTKQAVQKKTFAMNLPTSLNLQFDYHFIKSFYFSYNLTLPLLLKSDPNKSYSVALHTVSARIEKAQYSLIIPITMQRSSLIQVGIASRYSFKNIPLSFFIGSNNINNFLGSRARFTRNIFMGAVFNVRYEVPKDTDGDKISDLLDECMYDPGPAELKGCPDTDSDGIPDKNDYCIYTFGPKEKNGCPDSDGDGIIDLDDQCPEQAGLAVHYGCPDKDKDGVIDVADRCPDVPGIELNNGCPFENQMCCSDNDGDGISNKVDKCPEVSGSVYNNGCPIDQSNIDKIDLNKQKEKLDPNNTIDKVKEIKVEKINVQDGTVVKKVDYSQVIERLNVFFDYDDATLTAKYEEQIRALIKKYPILLKGKYKMRIVGHTDNDGSDTYNLILSKKRAETVRRKIEALGVDYDLIEVLYYGENKPLKSNENDENKQFNRRVEILIEPLD